MSQCNEVMLDFIRPGTPAETAVMACFNAGFRQECLNEHRFLSVSYAQQRVDAYREDYKHVRLHSSLANITPEQFAQQALAAHLHVGVHGSNSTATTTQRQRQEAFPTG